MPEISLIIANWNGKHFLTECLSSLRRQTFRNFETIFVDNGSDDGSVEFVRTQFPEVRLLALPENRGFTGGNLAGYELACGELIALLNNDTETEPRWLEQMHRAAQLYTKAGSFASKMMYFDERSRIENCGFDVGIAGTTIDLGRDELDGPNWSHLRSVFGACGGAALYRRRMLDEIGFLDPDFFLIYEDLDLSFRAQLRGYECVFVPSAIVYHRYRKSIAQAPTKQVYFSQRNVELVYLKNMPAKLILKGAPQRLMYELGSAAYFARQGATWAFLRAKLAVFKSLPAVLRKRGDLRKRKTITDAQLQSKLQTSLLSGKWKKFRAGWLATSQRQL